MEYAAESLWLDRVPDMPVFGRLRASGRPVARFCVSWTGLRVSPCRFFEDGIIQSKFRDDFLKLRVFLLQFLEPTGLVNPHPAIFFPPAVVGLLGDPNLLRDDSNGVSLAEQDLGFPEFVQDMVTMTEFCSRSK